MLPKKTQLEPELVAARSRIERWRESQGGRRRIPAEFWTLASELARTHGAYRVGQAMRLNGGRLRECMEARITTSPPSAKKPAFVEVSPRTQKPAMCTVEVISEDGVRVSIRAPSLADFARLFATSTASRS